MRIWQHYSPLAHKVFMYIGFTCNLVKENKCKYFLLFDKKKNNGVLP